MDPQLSQGLCLVVEHGQPAQAALARRLLEVLASPAGPAVEPAARDLVEAYLNDPHLTR